MFTGILFAILFLSSFCFLYNALDRLEEAGRIAVANPTMLAACLVGFTLYGAMFLHERPSRAQLLGTAFALAGIVLVAA
jgi:drug/metabolite transporter (DMT)-like permease